MGCASSIGIDGLAIPKNPITEERLNQLKESALEFLKTFGKVYAKNYGVAILQAVSESLETSEKTPWKLIHRDFNSVTRTDLFVGEVYQLEGAGLGDFGDWKKVFIVERSNYNIDVFASEKESKTSKKPYCTIQPGGYALVENVAEHYKKELLAQGLGISESGIASASKELTENCWALAHSQRKNYVFKNVEAKADNSKQPATASVVSDKTVLNVMKNCAKNAFPRDLNTPEGKAFEKTLAELPELLDSLKGFTDDGTEPEIMIDLLMAACLPQVKEAIVKDLTGPEMLKLKAWYMAQSVIQTSLKQILDPVWSTLQKGMKELRSKIEPTIRKIFEKIKTVMKNVRDKINELLGSKLQPLIDKNMSPVIKPFFELLEKPLKEGFSIGQRVIKQKVILAKLPGGKTERNAALDKIPRDRQNQEEIQKILYAEMKKCMGQLKASDVILRKDLFAGMDVDKIQTTAESLLLETMDAFINTLETKLDAGEKQPSLLDDLLLDYENDSKLCRTQFIKDVMNTELLNVFKQLAAPVVDPVIKQINGAIPEEMQDFLNIQQLYEQFAGYLLGEIIDKYIQGQ